MFFFSLPAIRSYEETVFATYKLFHGFTTKSEPNRTSYDAFEQDIAKVRERGRLRYGFFCFTVIIVCLRHLVC